MQHRISFSFLFSCKEYRRGFTKGMILLTLFSATKVFSQRTNDYKFGTLGLVVDNTPGTNLWGFSREKDYFFGKYYNLGTQECYTGGISPRNLDFGANHPRMWAINFSLVNSAMLPIGKRVKTFLFLRTGVSIMEDYNHKGFLNNPVLCRANVNLIDEPGIRLACMLNKTTGIYLEGAYRFYNGGYAFGRASDFNGLRITLGVCEYWPGKRKR